VVTTTLLLLVREAPRRPEMVYVLAVYPLADVRRVTFKKQNSNVVTVMARSGNQGSGAGETEARLVAHTLHFADAADFVSVLTRRLRPAPAPSPASVLAVVADSPTPGPSESQPVPAAATVVTVPPAEADPGTAVDDAVAPVL
jgi:hypothetical protein